MDANHLFAGIERVSGFRGAAVLDPYGRSLAEYVRPPLTVSMLTRFLPHMQDATDVFSAGGAEIEQVAMVATEGQLVAQREGGLLLVAIADAATNSAMLGVALNVVANKLRHESFVIASPPPAPTPTVIQAPPPAPTYVPPAPTPPKHLMVSKGAVRLLLHGLQRHIGPVAKISLQNTFNTFGFTVATIPWDRWPELTRELGQLIPADRRAGFVEEARRIPLDAE